MNMAAWLARAGRARADLPALAREGTVVATYSRFAENAARLASALRGPLGLAPGDRVAIVAKNSPHYLEVLYAIWWAGLAAVPVNAKLHAAEIGWILENCGARLVFAGSGLDAEVGAYAPDTLREIVTIDGPLYRRMLEAEPVPPATCAPDDLAWLFYTSGTTGRPKGAMLSHRNLMAMSLAYLSDVDPTSPGDTLLHAAPMSHGSGLYAMAHVARFGVNAVTASGGFEPAEVFDEIARTPGLSMFAAPTMIKRLTDHPGETPVGNIRTIIWGGAPMHVADAIRAIDRFGPRFAQIYGQGETPMTTTVLSKADIADRDNPRWRERLGSAGIANSAVEVRIDGAGDAPGVSGEILVRGDTVMRGYWNNPQATEKKFAGDWLLTGDTGMRDHEGWIRFVGRDDDVITSSGYRIGPGEIEDCLLKHPAVALAGVVGKPDTQRTEIVKAFIVLKDGITGSDELAKEIADFVKTRLAAHEYPREISFVDALPMTTTGKVIRRELRDRATQETKA